MSSRFLGPIGKVVAWITYLFIGYASLIAYVAGGSSIIVEAIDSIFHIQVAQWVAALLFVVTFGVIIDLGTKMVGRINAILVAAMVFAYFVLVGLGFGEVQISLLQHHNWREIFQSVPIVLTVFSFQCIIPSLTQYLKRNVKALRLSIIIGTTITFLVYLVWEFMVLGTVPLEGQSSLTMAMLQGEAATDYYRAAVNSPHISFFAAFFAFFALATSFLGLGLGLFDFLADGLKLPKKGKNKIILALLISVPSLYFALNYERIFLVALDISGGFGDSILNGLLPVFMTYVGRYWMKLKGDYTLPGGKLLLAIIFIFYMAVITLQIAKILV